MKNTFSIIILIFTLSLTLFGQVDKVSENQISFTVPSAPWSFVLNGKNFTVTKKNIKPDAKYGYFLMENVESQTVVSLFIEPAQKCKTSKECRDMVWKSGNPAWGATKEVNLGEIGEISYFEFIQTNERESEYKRKHIYAQFVKDGYWIDLHISKTPYKKSEEELLKNIFKTAKFENKESKTLEQAKKIMEDWRDIWDKGEHEKSYELLAKNTKESLSKRTWFIYWTAVRKPLGKVKSRKLVKFDYILSLKGLPNTEGIIYQFQSSFEDKDNVLETIALMKEKDGNWRVGNYLTNQELPKDN